MLFALAAALILDGAVAHARIRERLAQGIHARLGIRPERQGQLLAAREVHPEVGRSALVGHNRRNHNQRNGKNRRRPAQAHEINLRALNPLRHGELLQPAAIFEPVEHHAGADNGRVHAGHDAGGKRDGKALHGAGALPEQNHSRQQRREVRVKNGGKRLIIAGGKRRPEAFAQLHFFANALKNQNVGIHRHADGQHDTGDTRQRQHRQLHARTAHPRAANQPEESGRDNHAQRQQNQVEHKRQRRHDTGEAIVKNHENGHSGKANPRRAPAAFDGVHAKSRVHAALFDDAQRSRQSARAQHQRQVAGFFQREGTLNDRLAARNGRANERRRIESAIKHNAQIMLPVRVGILAPARRVVRGDGRKQAAALGVKRKFDHLLAELLIIHVGRLQAVAGQLRVAADVVRNEILLVRDNFFLQQQIVTALFLELAQGHALRLGRRRAFTHPAFPPGAGNDRDFVASGHLAVVKQIFNQLIILGVHHAEFQKCRFANVGGGAFAVFRLHAGDLHHNAPVAVGIDARLRHAHGVHAVAHHFQRAVARVRDGTLESLRIVNFQGVAGAPLQIEAQFHLFLGRRNNRHAPRGHHHQNQPFPD